MVSVSKFEMIVLLVLMATFASCTGSGSVSKLAKPSNQRTYMLLYVEASGSVLSAVALHNVDTD